MKRLSTSLYARTLRSLASVALLGLLSAAPAQAAVSLFNGSFEQRESTLLLNIGGGIYNATGWTNLTVDTNYPYHAATTPVNPGFENTVPDPLTKFDGAWYLRLSADNAAPSLSGRIAQAVGTMTAGETYTLRGDIFGFQGAGMPSYSAVIKFANEVAVNPSQIYATQTINSGLPSGTYLDNGINLSYTATAADNGKPLVVYMHGGDTLPGTAVRGGIDDLRLTTVPEPSTAILVGAAAAALGLRRRRA